MTLYNQHSSSIMAIQICLCLLFLSTTALLHRIPTSAAQSSHSQNYIIHMDLSAMPKAFSTQHSWYQATLETSKVTTTTKLIYTYTNAMNGFSANLTPQELQALKTSPGFISSTPDFSVKHDTTHTPQFLGLNPNSGVWPISQFGKDVIVGLVDTGVWPESESFKDDGFTKIPSRWKGDCSENSVQFNSSLCNKKLIGAKFFSRGLLSNKPNITTANSTRDTEGHGTHTSTTAAGSPVYGASFFGYAAGTATGVASRARVAMYKALWEQGAFTSDIIAAIDTAIADGVDVLSLSFGFDDKPLYTDPVAIATFAAMEKGIFVSTSAGNEGPFLQTLHNGTPWVITVASGTIDREFQGILVLENGVSIFGSSLYPGNFPYSNVPIIYMGLCNSTKELVKVKNNIVVCEDKYDVSLADQVSNVDNAKVVGAVFITNSSDTLFFLQNSFPSIIISPENGEIVKGYINKITNAKASMSFKVTEIGTRPAPRVDSYSSRGPSFSCPFVLKPDITAPGTLVLAAWPPNVSVGNLAGSQKLFTKFNVISGTSMACPHVAGVGALLKGTYPHWSPAAIRSAIMTTSYILDNTMSRIKDIGEGNKPASPFALGAGHVNPNRALDPGLIYDAGKQDYVNLLCALNFTKQNITAITRSSFVNCDNPSLDLNYPSFIAFYNVAGNSSETTTREFTRIVTNVGEGQTNYVASVTPIKGFRVSVIPNKLVFKKRNQKLSYKLRIEGPTVKKVKKVAFGYLTWTDVKHVVRSPIVVTTLKFF